MEIQEAIRHTFQITHYRNYLKDTKTLGKEKKLLLHLNDDEMIIKEQETIDRFLFKEMSFIYLVQKTQKENKKDQKKEGPREIKRYILYIKQKNHSGPSASFRHNQVEICKFISKFVNGQIQLKGDADQYETLVHKRNVINKIKMSEESVYRPIYEKYQSKGLFSQEWLDSFLFEDHQMIKEYNVLARERANENERKLILTKIKDKLKKGTQENQQNSEIPLQNYDFNKINEGIRFHDIKKVNFAPKQEDKEEDLIVQAMPNEEKYYEVDKLDQLNILDSEMEIQSSGMKKKGEIGLEKKIEIGVLLPKAEKEKFKLLQKKGISLDQGVENSIFSDKNKIDYRQFNEVIAKRVKIWIKIFYKIIGHSQLRREHINAIESQLNTLLNSEPKLPLFLERSIQKTQKNILEWKRNEGNKPLF